MTSYMDKGKETSVEVNKLKNSIVNVINYEKGKKLVYDNPKEALKIFNTALRGI